MEFNKYKPLNKRAVRTIFDIYVCIIPIFKKKITDSGLYAYFNMGRHYICHYFTPSDSEV